MPKSIEEVKAVGSSPPLDISYYMDVVGNITIEQLIFELEEKATKTHQGRKWTLYMTRITIQDAQTKASHGQEEALKDTKPYYFTAISVACQVGAGVAGGWFGSQAILQIGQGVGKGFDTVGDNLKNINDANKNALNHTYQRLGSQITEESNLIRETDQGMERSLNGIQRLMESQNRLAEAVVAS